MDLAKNIIVMDKNELIATVQKNRDQHLAIYTEAMAGYRTASVDKLRQMLANAEAGEIEHFTNIAQPGEHLKEYDRVIAALKMSVDSRATLNEKQFAELVMDDWSWKSQWIISAGSFSATADSYNKRR